MKNEIKMKQYVIDQVIQLVVFIVLAVGFYVATSERVLIMLSIEILIICSFTYLLKRVFVLPIDLIQGVIEQDVYFSSLCNIDKYEFFRKKYYCEWHFYFSAKDTLTLLVPVCQTHEEILQMDSPGTNQKVRICYYKHSKILCSWEVL